MTNQTSRFADRALIAIFALMLLAPLVCQVLHIDLKGGPSDEKRKTAPFPRVTCTAESLRKFPHGFDTWFIDHFGLRRALIRLHSATMYFGLRSSPNPKVIAGREGWLYYNWSAGEQGADSVSDYRGLKPMTPERLELWRWQFQDMHDWCAANGMKFFLVLIPSKEAIYPENTPGWMTKVTDQTAFEQMTAHLRQKAEFPWADVAPALREGRHRDRVFQKLDTHWTRFGAYCGYRSFLPMIAKEFPSVVLGPDSDFELSHEDLSGRDLAHMMALGSVMKEDYVMMRSKSPPQSKAQLVGNGTLSDLVTEIPDTNLPTAVVFRDSFAEDLVPFLSEHFRRAVFRWARTGIDSKIIEQEKPDMVIQIMADRLLRLGQPYPAQIRDFCAQQRFQASSNVVLTATQLRPISPCEVRPSAEGWTINATGIASRVELGSLTCDPEKMLPVVRMDVTVTARTDLYLIWHDRDGAEKTLRTNLAAGRQHVFLPLIEPDVRGPLQIEIGRRAGPSVLHAAEVRAIPR